MPNVSIVMTVFNGADFLSEAIQSVVDQSYTDWELIIIDNHSSDQTATIAKKFATKYEKIIYHDTKVHVPIATGLNIGFSFAQGQYWAKIDCDDVYYPTALEEMVSYLDTNPQVDFVYYDMEIIDKKGNVKGYWKVCPVAQIIYNNRVGCCMLYRASIARKVGDFNSSVTACDYEYWLRFSQEANMCPVNKCLFQYRRHDNNLTTRNERHDIIEAKQLMKQYYPFFINSRRKTALYYAHLRAMDTVNKWRQFYLFLILFYSPSVFFNVIYRRSIPDS